MRFEVVFEAVISVTDIRYPDPNGALYGPGLALFGEIIRIRLHKMTNYSTWFWNCPHTAVFSPRYGIFSLEK
jgi:hypothetical protein